jgi:hypothetical protein
MHEHRLLNASGKPFPYWRQGELMVTATTLTCMILVSLFVSLRVYRRVIATRNWGIDDCGCALA